MPTRNLGQVSGLWIGTTPPTNTDLIWLDTSLNPNVHKIYVNGSWIDLAPQVVTAISYTNLKTLAQNPGLAINSWYQISDSGTPYRNNVLALAVTTERILYVANDGNIIIDDLSSNTLLEFRIPCVNNLLLDGITGDWSNEQLNFDFAESTPSNAADYFLFGKRLIGGVFKLAKYKISNLISTVSGNSLTWNNGLYVNLNSLLSSRYDQIGGVTSYTTYYTAVNLINSQINVLNEYFQSLIGPYVDGGGVQHPDGIIDEKINAVYQSFQKFVLPSTFTPQKRTITPGTSKVMEWMENIDYLVNKHSNYDLAISPNSNLPYYGLKRLETEMSSNVKSVLIKKGTYIVDFNPNELNAINVEQLMTQRVVVDFEPGVVIRFYSSSVGYNFSLFYNSNNNMDIHSGFWNCNGAKVIAEIPHGQLYPTSFLKVFYNCQNIRDLIIEDIRDNNNNACLLLSLCHNLLNISGVFEDCDWGNIIKCKGEFTNCTGLTNCEGQIGSGVDVINCQGTFADCEGVILCNGTFANCSGMLMNRGTYSNCYADRGLTPTNPVANTAAGGWNI